MVGEPPHVPGAKVIGALDPEGSIAPVYDCQVALELPCFRQHRSELCAARLRQARDRHRIEPALRLRAGHFVAGERRNIEQADALAHGPALHSNDIEGVRALQRRLFLESGRPEVERRFKAPRIAPLATGRRHRIMSWSRLQRPPSRELLVGISHDETASVEFAGRLLDILAVGRVRPVAGDVEGESIVSGLAVDHPFREALADAAALQEAGHHAACEPIAAFAGDRANERITVRGECEGAIHPFADSGRLQDRVAAVDQFQLARNAIDVLLQELDPIVPRRSVHRPVLGVGLINSHQHALLVLAHVGKAFEVNDHRHFRRQRRDLRDRLGDEIMVFEGETGNSRPTIRPTCLAHRPAAFTTCSALIVPFSVTTSHD